VTLGWFWFLVTLMPESSVFPIRDVMVEHRAYLPIAGLCWCAAVPLAGWIARGTPGLLAVTLLIVALTAASHMRNLVWRDEVSLWSDVTRKSPHLPRGFNDLGMALEAENRLPAAGDRLPPRRGARSRLRVRAREPRTALRMQRRYPGGAGRTA
jgi:hypothetical protein